MSKVEIFDPAMCCSTGRCGPGVDPELLRMATMVSNLVKLHKDVTRHNLSEEPQVYVDNAEVNTVLLNEGADALPITLVDGEVYRKGSYPSNEELMEWTGTDRSEMAMAMLQEKLSKSSCCCGGGKGGDGGCCG